MSQLSPELRARLLRSVAAAPSRAVPWARRAVLASVVCAGWVVLGVALPGPHGEGPRLAPWYVATSLLLVGGSGAALLALSLSRGRYMVGPSVERMRLLAALPLASLVWILATAPAVGAESQPAWRCHSHGLLLGLPLLALLVALRRGLPAPASALLGACLGACTGAWVHVILFAICADGSASHGAIGHVLPALPLMLVGAAAGHRWLRG